jgi:FkbM family methyltransferase
MKYNGQNLEDKIIWEYFQENYGSDFKGNVLDLGANDGVFLSNSRIFIENGWKGILLEASRKVFNQLKSNYIETDYDYILIECAISNKNEFITFYESGSLITNDDYGLVSTIVPSELNRWSNKNIKFETYQVECKTFDGIFGENNEYGINNDIILDFISIDVEGMDYNILTQIDLTKYKCKCLCIEFNGIEKNKYINYANSHGMILYYQNGENLIFTLKNII